jgi:DNA-directed RNA polymerase subunit RPC12/RpoP
MKCKCGFEFAGPGQFRNCEAFVTEQGQSGVICPECGTRYVNGQEVEQEEQEK